MNEFDGTAGSNCIEERNVDPCGNIYGESNGAIKWESDATSDRESGGTAYSDIALFMKKNTTKTNGKIWKLRALCALNVQFCSAMETMCKYCIYNPFYVDRASSILLKYASRHCNVFIYT